MIKILIYNSKSKLCGETILIDKIRRFPNFRIRAQNFFWAQKLGNTGSWDGYVMYITDTGLISTGLIPELIAVLKEKKIKYTIEDKRELFRQLHDINEVGNLELRGYQKEAVETFLNYKVEGLRFQRGILWEATNAGKNLIAAAVFSAFANKRLCLFLINNTVIFEQAVVELTELLGDEVGQVCSKKTDWRRVNVCMVQTLSIRAKSNPRIKADIINTDIIVVDEGDEVINRKDTRWILDAAHNAPVRLSLTGSTQLHKDKNRNKREIQFFGPILHITRNKQLVEEGFSAKPTITILEGNTLIRNDDSWQEEYLDGIVRSSERNKKVWKRVKYHISKGRVPILILIKLHEHIDELMKCLPKSLKGYRIEHVHGKTKNREQILKDFNSQKIDILICSMIIRRGKNMPLMRALVNAAGGDSYANTLQVLGRLLRLKIGEKEEGHMDDFYDKGLYLRKHSKHRYIYYKNEGFPVNQKYLKTIGKTIK